MSAFPSVVSAIQVVALAAPVLSIEGVDGGAWLVQR
jgi:hypothetical protein